MHQQQIHYELSHHTDVVSGRHCRYLSGMEMCLAESIGLIDPCYLCLMLLTMLVILLCCMQRSHSVHRGVLEEKHLFLCLLLVLYLASAST
jgi:hypothetical protein